MSVTSKSPVKIVLAALAAARRSFPAYRYKCSPKKFTQHQLFACLVLKSALKLDYRGVTAPSELKGTGVDLQRQPRWPGQSA